MEKNPQISSTNNINGRNSSASNSPEFEFWMIRNPSSQQQNTLHSADELFAGGILLPLERLTTSTTTESISPDPGSDPNPDPDLSNGADIRTKDIGSVAIATTSSKRWKDIFKKNPIEKKEKEKEKKKKKERTGAGSTGSGSTTTAELNINLWPFSRSRSAGTGGRAPPRTAAVGNRKVSSAPCSRSNSTGETKYRKWPGSPNRGGVHLGRSSPVWQVKRFGQSKSLHDHLVRTTAEKSSRPPAKNCNSGDGAGVNGKVLNINVPTCIGYRQKMSCRSDVAGGNGDGAPASVAGGEGGASGLFNLRSLFTKKVF